MFSERDGDPAWTDLGEAAAIDQDVKELLSALRNPNSRDFKQRARRLDETLMRPIRKLLGNTRTVLLSPDGELNRLPFGALVDEEGRYLIERYLLSYLTSGRDLLRLQVHSEGRESPMILANPAFDDDGSGTESKRTAPSHGKQVIPSPGDNVRRLQFFDALPGTAEEATQLAAVLGGAKVLTGAQATESAIKKVHGPSILHIATHGFFLPDKNQESNNSPHSGPNESSNKMSNISETESPLLRSGLALAGANRSRKDKDDGVLTGLEAAWLDLWGTKLVVLSACETGVGDVENGEGVYGLRRALVMAGAEAQVMSLWEIETIATKELMVKYYNRLVRGEGRSEALREVQLEMLQGKRRGHPYYWAGFIASGEWANLQGKR